MNETTLERIVFGKNACVPVQPQIALTRFQVGRQLCRAVRDYLSEQKFLGRRIEWHETSGILSRRFTIKGDAKDVARVSHVLMAWFDEMRRKEK